MIKFIQRLATDSLVYVRIRQQLLSVRKIMAKKTLVDVPVLAISKGKSQWLLGMGSSAETEAQRSGGAMNWSMVLITPGLLLPTSLWLINPATFLAQSFTRGFRVLSPVAVIQALEKTEGRLTQFEICALGEMAMGAGARKAYVWTGQELTDHNFARRQFPGDYWMPEIPEWVKSSGG